MDNHGTCIHPEQTKESHPYRRATPRCGGRQDLLRRFSSTPFATDLQLMGRTIRVESNSGSLLRLARIFFQSHQHGNPSKPEFLWRLMCESDDRSLSTAVPISAFSDVCMSYLNIGQRGFLAVDLAEREAVGFFSEAFLREDARFRNRPPLDVLFSMTASSLGLVPLSGGCVAKDGRGVLVFGAPNSGKTTSCYLAARSGLEFEADQVVFLDARNPNAWGDPFPAVFRSTSLQYLPELQSQVHHSTYENASFCYFDKSCMQPKQSRPILPVASVFLERGTRCQTMLRTISHGDALSRLRSSVLFEEDEEREQQIVSSLQWLTEKPAYELRYDSNPRIAADYLQKLVK